jgi:hypothetical protein
VWWSPVRNHPYRWHRPGRAPLQRTNFTTAYAPLSGNMTVTQNLRFFGLLYGVKRLSERLEALLEQFTLAPFRDVKCGLAAMPRGKSIDARIKSRGPQPFDQLSDAKLIATGRDFCQIRCD